MEVGGNVYRNREIEVEGKNRVAFQRFVRVGLIESHWSLDVCTIMDYSYMRRLSQFVESGRPLTYAKV